MDTATLPKAAIAEAIGCYAETVEEIKKLQMDLKDLRPIVLDAIPAGESFETKYGKVCHDTTNTLIVDGDLIDKLKGLGLWARVRKTTADVSKVRALAKIDGNVRRFLRFKPGSRIDVR